MSNPIGTEINLPDGNGGHNPFYPKTDYENLVDAQVDIVASHNNLIRGKEISLSWADLKTKIQAGDFSDIYPGDFKEITLTTDDYTPVTETIKVPLIRQTRIHPPPTRTPLLVALITTGGKKHDHTEYH